MNHNGTVADLKRITDAQVATVYKLHYWNKVKGDDLPSGVDYAVFEFAVNSGPKRAAERYHLKCPGGFAELRRPEPPDPAVGTSALSPCSSYGWLLLSRFSSKAPLAPAGGAFSIWTIPSYRLAARLLS